MVGFARRLRMYAGTVRQLTSESASSSASRSRPETSRNSNGENQEPNEDRFQNDPQSEVGNSINWSPYITDPVEASYNLIKEVAISWKLKDQVTTTF